MSPSASISGSARLKLVAAALLTGLAGCATSPTPKRASTFVFYPPPPDPPRLQFLTSFAGEKDLRGGPGKFAAFVTGVKPTQRVIGKPYGLALHHCQLYACDTSQGAVAILDLVQQKFAYLEPKGGGQMRLPINITIDQDGTRYVADRGHNQVLVYGPDDTFQGAIGEASTNSVNTADQPQVKAETIARQPQGLRPTDVAVTGDRIYVTDLSGNGVRVYDKANRELRFKIPLEAKDPAAKLFAPVNLALDTNNCLYVSDLAGCCVKKYDPNGKYLQTFGRAGDRPGEFARPKGVAVDREGRVYVVDAAAQVIQVFAADGQLLMFFGEPRAGAPPLNLPTKVTINYDDVGLFRQYAAPGFELEYVVLASNQLGDRKVNVYGFGHQKDPSR